MRIINVSIDAGLLRTADLAAKRQKLNRSALIRQALQEYLNRLRISKREERDRRGYESQPQLGKEVRMWERAAVWTED